MTKLSHLVLLPAFAMPVLLSGASGDVLEGMRQPARSRLGVGGYHSCAIRSDGKVYCWGRNNYGQLGDNTQLDRLTPVWAFAATGAIALAAGNNHTCLLTVDGNVACWGRNQHGQLGLAGGDRLIPTLVPNLTGVTRLAAGEAHTCAALVSGEVRCWGRNHLGQLGFNSAAASSNVPVTVVRAGGGNLGLVTGLALGNHHSCAVRVNGVVWCWGDNADGQTAAAGANTLVAVQVTGLPAAATLLAAGARHTCAALSNDQLYCWGYNSEGQLGDQTGTSSSIPVLARIAFGGITGLSAGLEHTCMIYRSRNVYCWGANGSGELGDGTVISRDALGANADSYVEAVVSSQNRHNCLIKADGKIACWGKNSYGQIGNGSTADVLLAFQTLLDDGEQARQLAVGADHTCALRANGQADCWGNNASGALGDGTYISRTIPDPARHINVLEVRQAGADDSYACVSRASGTFCHGRNNYGQLGTGTNIDTNAATTYVGTVLSFGQAEQHTCLAEPNGSVKCWGRNLYGQLGDNTVSDRSNPVTVNGVYEAVMVTAGRGHSCALIADGTVKCWGLNSSGQLGDGSFTDRLTPVTVSGVTDAIAISAGGLHTCALRAGGRIVCWGNNVEGQLGDGLTTNRNSYTTVMGITTAVAVVASAEGNCALLADGTAKCWGDNYYGQVGDGTNSDRLTPAVVADPVLANGLRGVASLAATSSAILNISNCAVKADGKPHCWGSNAAGKLGDGTTTNRNKPTAVLTF